MLSLFDFAEVGAAFAAFFTLIFVLVRRPHHISASLYTVATLASLLFWAAFIIAAREDSLGRWEHGAINAVLSITIALWLLFLSSFARETPYSVPRSWAWPVWFIVGCFLISGVAGFFWQFVSFLSVPEGPRVLIVNESGRYMLVLIIVACAFGLLQLENTFRASSGSTRRSLILPAGSFALLLAIALVSASLGLMYTYIKFLSIQIAALASIITMVFVSRFLAFEEEKQQRVVISRQAVYSSVGILLVGGYLVLVAVAVQLLTSLGGSPRVFFSALAAFIVIMVLLAFTLSGSLKARIRRVVDRSILAGKIDLPAELTSFAEDVTAAVDPKEMFRVTESVLEEKCGLKEIKFALREEQKGMFRWYPAINGDNLRLPHIQDWLLRSSRMSSSEELRTGIEDPGADELKLLKRESGVLFVPLIARQEFVGIMICHAEGRMSADARMLTETVSHQLALSLLSARQYEKLLETKELASFNKISSFVIHDVKNLISMVSMILQNADRKFDDPRFQQTTIETLSSAQQRMKRMVNRLASPQSESVLQLDDCDLRRLVVDLVSELKLGANRKIATSLEIPDLPPVRANEEKLKSVVGNLLINALEAMPAGGELTITADEDNEKVFLHVKDAGVGMGSDFIRDKLFRPFQTSKPNGLGIGLFQSKELVQQMEGELRVASTPGQGTTFTLMLRKS